MFSMTDKTGHITILILCLAVMIIAFFIDVDKGLAVIPMTEGAHSPRLCLFYKITGMDCPFCGLTRGFSLIAHGNVSGAIKFNSMSIAVFLFFVGQIIYRSYILIRGCEVRTKRIYLNIPWIIIVTGLFLNWIYNLVNSFS
jgi:Protein of unknown function (DUF2752)